MELALTDDAARVRRQLTAGDLSPAAFRGALTAVPAIDRDGWLDRVLGIDGIPDDGPDLPRGCVPYLPSAVDTVVRAAELAGVGPADVFVDVGSGIGRACALMHFLTGAGAIGIEIQSDLVRAARGMSERLHAPRIAAVQGDAVELTGTMMNGTVFFLYCPFSGERLARVVDDLEDIAKTRTIRVCTVDLPLPARSWLEPVAQSGSLAVYRSVG